jgi:hypothetical protein
MRRSEMAVFLLIVLAVYGGAFVLAVPLMPRAG